MRKTKKLFLFKNFHKNRIISVLESCRVLEKHQYRDTVEKDIICKMFEEQRI